MFYQMADKVFDKDKVVLVPNSLRQIKDIKSARKFKIQSVSFQNVSA